MRISSMSIKFTLGKYTPGVRHEEGNKLIFGVGVDPNRFRKCYSVNEMTLDFPITHYSYILIFFSRSCVEDYNSFLLTDKFKVTRNSTPARRELSLRITKEVIKTYLMELIEQVTFRDFF